MNNPLAIERLQQILRAQTGTIIITFITKQEKNSGIGNNVWKGHKSGRQLQGMQDGEQSGTKN
jgi:hypothetical protein